MSKKFVVVAGNIGSGKTTITERLGSRLGWHTGYESVADNPYLADFYQDMRQWSFHLQIFFLGHRAQQHLELAARPGAAISDRSIYEDATIFARALYHLHNLNERDYQAYQAVFRLITTHLPRPDLLLYLKTPVPVLLERIQQRGRVMEQGITADYLTLLEQFYEEWLAHFDLCPVLTIHTEKLNFVQNPAHLDLLVQKIEAKLAGKEEIYLD